MGQANELWRELKGPLTAIACVFLGFMLAMAAFSAINGVWPPFMAVESKSMQHSDDSSQVGVIDTGDIVVARATDGPQDVRTYYGSIADGYRTYGGYGDVVIYQPEDDSIPVVHRAIIELVYNGDGSFDAPDLADVPHQLWSAEGAEGRWWGLTDSLDLFDVGYAGVDVHIDLRAMMVNMGASPHGGLITMGDNNWYELGGGRYGAIDQEGIVDGPVPWEDVIGKVAGEVPWIGSLRLWLTGTAPDYLPVNSIVALGVLFGGMVLVPAAVWGAASLVNRSKRR